MVLLRGARARLLAAEHQLKKEDVSAASLRRIANEVDAAARHVAIGSPLAGLVRPAQPAGPPASEEQLRPGTRVRLRKLGTVAEVIDVPQHGEVRVLAGSMKLVVRVDEVEVPKQRGTTSSQRDTKRKATQSSFVSVPVNPARTSGNTIDLRGQRVDDALEMVDVFIDKMMAEGEPAGFVLHGHGTGALKAAVRGHLRKNRFVERANAAEPDDGGDAFTLFRLKA
jgi:DNA mismatch repair protein MutS2